LSHVTVGKEFLNEILFGSPGGRRFTQDTPVLPDVWAAFAQNPAASVSGLIVPRKSHQAHLVANELYKRMMEYRIQVGQENRDPSDISDMPGLISLRCYFDDVVNVVLPLTRWWETEGLRSIVGQDPDEIITQGRNAYAALCKGTMPGARRSQLTDVGKVNAKHLGAFFYGTPVSSDREVDEISDSTARLLLALAVIHAARTRGEKTNNEVHTQETLSTLNAFEPEEIGHALGAILKHQTHNNTVEMPLSGYYRDIAEHAHDTTEAYSQLIFTLGLNRSGDGAAFESVPTTKADAARRLFNLSNGSITWAVIDSGIDAGHVAFQDLSVVRAEVADDPHRRLHVRESRVDRRYNMTLISDLRNRDVLWKTKRRNTLIDEIARTIDLPGDPNLSQAKAQVREMLKYASNSLKDDQQIDWDLAERLMRLRHDCPPSSHHGTHVAGILGGQWTETRKGKRVTVSGMCPDIKLMDFNVLGQNMQATEFAVAAALRLIRHLNERNDYMVIHGANISLAIPHDVTNYACGRTPVCVECENAVANGVVVVAAAGNTGFNVFMTESGSSVPLHTESSIADPGNADGVITVGSTHRLQPHTYGVSYFSSRGPTGDGRMKPDLIAPGEKINGPICGGEYARLEGTSMAAPHVSGAAALLMARFPELVGQPSRIKQILCETATDLGRERAYQGAGLVDVLRALQSV